MSARKTPSKIDLAKLLTPEQPRRIGVEARPVQAVPIAMIVDDARTVRESLKSILAPGHECLVFADVETAFEAALARPPDIIISDVVMDPIDGNEFCRRIRSEPLLKEIPFVLLTSQTDPDGRAAGLEDGADDYLSKPVRPRELLAKTKSLLHLRDARLEVIRQKLEIAAAHDELLLAQRQLLASEKLATLGTLAAGVAHEINNPLGFVLSGVNQLSTTATELAELGPDEDEERNELLKDVREIHADILTGIDRIRGVVQNLGLLSRDLELPPISLDVGAEIERSLAIAASKLSSIELVRDMTAYLRVCVTPGYITQIVLNLLENAADAARPQKQPKVIVRSKQVDGGVEVCVEDNGAGIPPDVLPRIFEPFFTTKPAGAGTGLGLSVCYGLARRLGGGLSVRSQPGQGTVFALFVPTRTQSPDQDFCRSRIGLKSSPR